MQLPALGRRSLHQTSSRDYGSGWSVGGSSRPSYAEVVDALPQYRRAERLIKNKLVAEKFGSEELRQRAASQIGRTFRAESFTRPEHGMNVGNLKYCTNNMSYGSQLPSPLDMPSTFAPYSSRFTSQFTGQPRTTGLNTARTYSKVHSHLDQPY